MNKKQQKRQQVIEKLASGIIEKAQLSRGGCACLVPSASEAGKFYRVDVDADYRPVACQCRGGRRLCQHKEAVVLFYAPRMALLLNSTINPVYAFYRAGQQVEARLSQFSKAEKAALLEYQRQQEAEAVRRAAYVAIFDPNGIDSLMYA